MTTVILTDGSPHAGTPLNKFAAIEIRNRFATTPVWRSIASWKIARSSFSQLKAVWKDNNEFRATLLE